MTPSSFATRLARAWYRPHLGLVTLALTPLSALFAAASAIRRTLYRAHVLASHRLPVPVIVVGNISVGGTGKTPLVMALARALAARGWHPGLVSRGYGAADTREARVIDASASASSVGDEPLLLARAGFPVAVGRDRAAAGRALLVAHPDCDVIIADDGLQHYALERDVEIAVLDAARNLGNGWRLPAGPLREPVRRLDTTDAIVVNGPRTSVALSTSVPKFGMWLNGDLLHAVNDPQRTLRPKALRGMRVHAVAGIGNPERFFAHLRGLGLAPVVHPFPDHYAFTASDLALPDAQAIVMTEKDAVKCSAIADARCWFLPVRAELDPALVDRVLAKLATRAAQARDAKRAPAH